MAKRRCWRSAPAVLVAIALAPVLVACTPATVSPSPSASATAASDLASSVDPDASGTPVAEIHRIDLGDGRQLYMTCAGRGRQTVVLESGYHESSDAWMVTADATDRSVFARLADRYRVCAYDRAGTLLLLAKTPSVTARTTPVPMPRTAADVVKDLHAALEASGEQGPYLFAAHSMGGLLARLYAQTYPDDVKGLVFVDSFPIEMPQLLGDKWKPYDDVLNSTGGGEASKDYEQLDIEASITQIEKAGAFPEIPIGVISKQLPFAGLPDKPVGFAAADLERAWAAGQPKLIALRPNSPHLVATGSDHYIHVRQPDLVEAMVDIVAGRVSR